MREAVTGQLMHVELASPESQAGMQPSELPEMHAHHIDPFSGLDELALADAAIAAEQRGPVGACPRSSPAPADAQEHDESQSHRSGHLGPCRAQRLVPVRLRQEVQALSRQERLISNFSCLEVVGRNPEACALAAKRGPAGQAKAAD